MRRIALVALPLGLVGLLAACGGGGGHTGTSTTTGFTPADKAQITSNYEKFFSSKTPTPQRVQLLQNGQAFQAAITALAQNPLASNTSAKVSSVTPSGANMAKVVYTVNVSGVAIPGLKNRAGTAVKEGGTWKVGDASFCALISLGGSPPKVCKKS